MSARLFAHRVAASGCKGTAHADACAQSSAGHRGWIARLVRLVQVAGLAVAGMLGVGSPAVAVPVCGSGAHWVDACPGGIDFFPLTNGVHTIDVFGLGVFNLFTTGPTTVWRGAGSTSPDHHIDTELVSLTLTGGGLTLTAGDGVADGLNSGPLHSPGRITEQAGDNSKADSFFDIFFEIDGTPFGPLHSSGPCHMTAVLDRVPPAGGTTYVCDLSLGPILLVDSNGNSRGQLIATSHEIPRVPAPATLALAGLALVTLACLRRRQLQGR